MKSSSQPTANSAAHSSEMKYADLTSKIIGSAMQVHGILGNGFQEVIYQRALAIEFGSQNLPHERESEQPVFYKGFAIGTRRVDFFVSEKILVEIKATIQLGDVHLAQAINYLEAFNMEIGMLLNFGSKSLQFKRLINKKFRTNGQASCRNSEQSSGDRECR